MVTSIPDDWEVVNDLDPLTDDATLDPDNDGLSNLEEFENGTDPAPPKDVTQLELVSIGDDGFTISWTHSTSPDIASYLYHLDPDPTLVDIGLVTTYTFTNLEPGRTYTGAIHARDTSGNTTNSTEFSVSVIPKPAPPASLAGFSENASAVLILERSPTPRSMNTLLNKKYLILLREHGVNQYPVQLAPFPPGVELISSSFPYPVCP